MAPAGQYVFAEMLGISEHFTAGSHEWLPYSVIPTFPKLICKHQFVIILPLNSIAPGDCSSGAMLRYSTARAMVVITVMPRLSMYTAW